MVYLLKAFGHQPIEARDGAEAIELMRREQPDLVLMDVHMPRMDGYEAARRLKVDPVLQRVPLVAVTALAMVGDRDKVMAAGFHGYIAKPIQPENFVSQVESFLGDQPTGPRPVAHPTTPGAKRPQPTGATILFVDNSPVNRHLFSSTLEPFGYKVIVAASVDEAMGLARESPPDLIVSDLHMPQHDGFDFFRMAQADARLRSIPFVLLSATVQSDRDRLQAKSLGAARFITRPLEPEALVTELRACLAGRKP